MRRIIVCVATVVLAIVSSEASHAEDGACPHTVLEGQYPRLITGTFKDEVLQLEDEIIRGANPEATLKWLTARLDRSVNDKERQLLFRYLSVLYSRLERPLEAAAAAEASLRIGWGEPMSDQLKGYTTVIRIYRHFDRPDAEARMFQLWESCGGEPDTLRDSFKNCPEGYEGLCFKLTDGD